MSVPKKRRTRSSVKKRQSHHSLARLKLSVCPKCGEKIPAHSACPVCGTYKGRRVIKLKSLTKSKAQS